MRLRRKKFLFSFLLLAIFAVSLFLIYKTNPLAVRNIIVTTDYDVNQNLKLEQILNKTRGQNIFIVDEQKLALQIKKTDIKIKEVKIEKQLLGKLLINISRRNPIAVVAFGKNYLLIDQDGLFFDMSSQAGNLPIASFNLSLQNFKVGSTIDKENKKALDILVSLGGKEEVKSISVGQEDIQLELISGTIILFPKLADINAKVTALQVILSRFRIEGKRPVKIDLRFEKPVVMF